MDALEAIVGFLSIFQGIPVIAYILFMVGLALLMFEMSIPGFGVAGGCSIIAFLASIIIAADTVTEGLIFAGIVILVSAVIVIAFLYLLSKGKLKSAIILETSTSRSEGFTSAAEDLSGLKGMVGKAETVLRPAGRAEIGGRVYDVVTSGNFIEAGSAVRVEHVIGNRIVVMEDRT